MSGGVLSSNPIGASGLLRFAEAALQVRGQAGEHQVEGARTAVGHAYGGGSAVLRHAGQVGPSAAVTLGRLDGKVAIITGAARTGRGGGPPVCGRGRPGAPHRRARRRGSRSPPTSGSLPTATSTSPSRTSGSPRSGTEDRFRSVTVLVNNGGSSTSGQWRSRTSRGSAGDRREPHRHDARDEVGGPLDAEGGRRVDRQHLLQQRHLGIPMAAAHCSSKWAVRGLSKAGALCSGRHGIRVNPCTRAASTHRW